MSELNDRLFLTIITAYSAGIQKADLFAAMLFSFLPGFTPETPRHERGLAARAIQDTIRGLGVVAVTLVVLLLVINEIFQAIDIENTATLKDADNAVRNNTGTALLLGGVALIVVAAIMILNIIQGGSFGGR